MFTPKELTDRQLRYFGVSLSALFLALAAVAYWKWHASTAAGTLVGVAAVLTTVYYAVPATRRKIYRGFLTVTRPIQLVMTAVILAIVYFAVLTPIGLLLRCSGKSIRAKPDDSASYWTQHQSPEQKSRYFDTY